MYVFHLISARANGIIIRANCSLLSLFSLSYPLMSNEVDTQDDIDPLTHIAE
jgi:hypothetical protein